MVGLVAGPATFPRTPPAARWIKPLPSPMVLANNGNVAVLKEHDVIGGARSLNDI